MTIKLEVGQLVQLNNGREYKVSEMLRSDPLSLDCSEYGPFFINGTLYRQDGTFGAGDVPELNVSHIIEEVKDMTTDKKVKLEVGQRVQLNNGKEYKVSRMMGKDPNSVDHFGFGPFMINEYLYHQDGTFGDNHLTEFNVSHIIDGRRTIDELTNEQLGEILRSHIQGKTLQIWQDDTKEFIDMIGLRTDSKAIIRVKPDPVITTVTLNGGVSYCGNHWVFSSDTNNDETYTVELTLADGVPTSFGEVSEL